MIDLQNSSRGQLIKPMILTKKLSNNQQYKEGAYGGIFLDKDNNTAIKVFKKSNTETYTHRKKTFDNEIKAYQLALKDVALELYIPKFYGKQNIQKVLDEKDKDLSTNFYLDLNYKMELINGQDCKFATLDEETRHKFTTFFQKAGIYYYKDASVFLDAEGSVKKIIDFSTEEIELWH